MCVLQELARLGEKRRVKRQGDGDVLLEVRDLSASDPQDLGVTQPDEEWLVYTTALELADAADEALIAHEDELLSAMGAAIFDLNDLSFGFHSFVPDDEPDDENMELVEALLGNG